MIDLERASTRRCLLVQAVATATAGLLLAVLVPVATDPAVGFEAVLVRGCTLALAGCTAWAWLSVTLVVREARVGRLGGTSSRGVPQGLRTLVLRACGLALVGATVAGHGPAVATPDHLQQGTDLRRGLVAPLTDPLVGLPLPQRALGQARARTRVTRVRVEPGDTLWGLAAERLVRDGRRPTDAAVAAYWPRVHLANRDVVPDPDLLRPGQALRLPPT